MAYKTLNIPLTEQEWNALVLAAQRDYRFPKQQAIYLLRCALGLATDDDGGDAEEEQPLA